MNSRGVAAAAGDHEQVVLHLLDLRHVGAGRGLLLGRHARRTASAPATMMHAQCTFACHAPPPVKNTRSTNQYVPARITPTDPGDRQPLGRAPALRRTTSPAAVADDAGRSASWPISTPMLNENSDQPSASARQAELLQDGREPEAVDEAEDCRRTWAGYRAGAGPTVAPALGAQARRFARITSRLSAPTTTMVSAIAARRCAPAARRCRAPPATA